ncbi:MAG TPA: chemotaxis protein CheB, partial [Gemmatimonadaceae bacterium]|nr:chemotaxis protein CheB [Gemmatimonadaceae bacterium]
MTREIGRDGAAADATGPQLVAASAGEHSALESLPRPLDTDEGRLPPVVGIGASAGGLESFVRLVSHLAPDTGLAYVLVQHLDPAHESLLPEILGRVGSIPVIGAVDGVRLEANHAYVIPPNASMTVRDGHLRVALAERRRGAHTVIDEFLQSLATVHRGDAVGVILSGSGSDGSFGIESIKEYGGITLAQEPGSAQSPSMPESAIATGCIDFVLTPEQIAEQLSLIARQLSAPPDSTATATDDADMQEILVMLRNRTGADFRSYRRAMVHRRILRRMVAHRNETKAEYLQHLRSHPGDLDVLHEDLLIGVTRFFRDQETFAALQGSAFPAMMKGRPADAPIRVWIAGCSGGEEAYSVAIALLEFLDATGAADTAIDLFATDLSDVAIARARAGLYPETIEADVSAERLERFFIREDGGYRVTRRVRDLCVFATQNIVRDPPFSQLDLISCRNVLIYFEAALQERAISMFHYALRPSGLLLLGAAESVGSSAEFFTPFDKRHRIFRPQASARRLADLDRGASVFPAPRAVLARERRADHPLPDAIRQDADRAVLARFGPPGIVINERFEITQFRGDTTRFVQHNAGVASLHLFKVVRPELLPRLRVAIEAARHSRGAVREEQIALRDGGVVRHVAVEAIPFWSGGTREPFFVILFDGAESSPIDLSPANGPPRRGGSSSGTTADVDSHAVQELLALREEVAEAKRYLQDVIEQYEGANEELRAANEEIQSSNEELQSTTEELETTKEEVQSTNEELTTVNEELRHRNCELAATSADLNNVFASTQIPILIVDADLLVRRFTPITERVIRVIPTDVGRPLGDLRVRIDLPDLEARITSVIDTLVAAQVDVQDDEGRWWSLTIRPYLTVDRKVDGAVLVFTDIDVAKLYGQQAEEMSESRRMLLLEAEDARLEALAASLVKTSFLANMSHDLRTPLNAISGYADILELLIHGPLTPNQQSDVGRIKRSARHLLSLINDILNFAKVEAGSLDLRIGVVAVEGVITSIDEMLHLQVVAKGLTFTHGDCAAFVRADPEKLLQVLLNLMTNAVKFTPSGGIVIRAHSTDTTVSIEVIDTGIGIPADELDRIFEPFIQVSRSLTNVDHDGVGLGLSISRDLARSMGGDLTVLSTL